MEAKPWVFSQLLICDQQAWEGVSDQIKRLKDFKINWIKIKSKLLSRSNAAKPMLKCFLLRHFEPVFCCSIRVFLALSRAIFMVDVLWHSWQPQASYSSTCELLLLIQSLVTTLAWGRNGPVCLRGLSTQLLKWLFDHIKLPFLFELVFWSALLMLDALMSWSWLLVCLFQGCCPPDWSGQLSNCNFDFRLTSPVPPRSPPTRCQSAQAVLRVAGLHFWNLTNGFQSH